MFRLLIAAAVAVGAWALLRRKGAAPPSPGGRPYKESKTRTTIVIGGIASHPVITQEPETLRAYRGQELIWDIRNDTTAPQEIALRDFKKEGAPPPLNKSDDERKLKADQKGEIRDRVRGGALGGIYKYDIYLNGQLAVDPDVEIWEEGGG